MTASSLTSRLATGALLILSLFITTSNALSNGAASCEGGRAAVSGVHTSPGGTILTGELSQDDIEFQLNGVALQPGVPFNIEIGVDYTWKLITAGTYFRGFLVRLGRGNDNVDTRQSLTVTGPTAKLAETACVDAYLVGGVTHNSNVLKNLEQGTLAVHLPSQNMALDVTVVIQNRNGYSIYYYSQFTLNANPPTTPQTTTDSGPNVTPTYTPYFPPPTATPSKTPAPVIPVQAPVTPAPITPAPVTPAPVTPAPITPAPVTPAPATPAPVTPAPVTPIPAPMVAYLFLRYPTCSSTAPCSGCQGDCDTDAECAGDLECFHRPEDDTSPVPGCAGEGVAGRDYCYAPQKNALRPRMPECTDENPCAACYGDCDMDSHCMPGLNCFIRSTGELTPIFGCSGLGIAGLDYCYNASAVAQAAGLAAGDREDESNSTITSTVNSTLPPPTSPPVTPTTIAPAAPNTTAPSTTAPVETSLVIRADECSTDLPCLKCEGGCNNDDDCDDGLACFRRQDLSVVPGCGNGFRAVNFCWNPADFNGGRKLLRHSN